MNQRPLEVRAVLLPLQHGQLLLPNASVAEIAAFREPSELPGSPEWLLGMVSWRWKEVPLVCFDTLTGVRPGKRGIRARIAICYTLSEAARYPFLGILTQSVPHLTRATEDTLASDPTAPPAGEGVIESVRVNGERAWIPDLDAIESMIETALAEIAP